MIGACTNHHDPDMWFPETQLSVGRPSRKAHQDMVERAITAMNICQTCPVRAKCLELGMREENIEHGIWGGMLAGDRIILARSRRSGTIREQALAFAEGVKAWQTIG
jgi:hypothetical protein